MSDESVVGVVGSGPAVEAVVAAMADVDGTAERLEASAVGSVESAVVTGPVGDDRFGVANDSRSGAWIAVELGGLGGQSIPGLTAGVSVLAGDGPCFDCLSTRVRSALDEPGGGTPTVARADARLAGAHAARLAVNVHEGANEVGTVVELPYTRRTLLPVPGCSCDPGDPVTLDDEYESVGLEATVQRAERAVDPRLGPVTSVGEAESFPAPYYLATLADTGGFSDARASPQAAGVAADWNPAFVKAVGEALERYAAGVYRESAFVAASANDLESAVPPSRFVAPDEGSADPGADEPIAWVEGQDLRTGSPVHLPAERVHFPPPEERLGPAITTGLGLGTSGAGALVAGLTEVIERDATMLGWYSTFEPLALAVEDDHYGRLVRRARSEDLDVTALLMTQDVDIPVVTVAVHRASDWPQFAVGSGAALDPVAAAVGALEEALQNWMELRGMGPQGADEEEPTLARYAQFPPAARAFVDVEETIPAAGVGPDDPPSGADELAAVLDRVEAAGLDAYAAPLTRRDVDRLGFEVVRVLVPEAQPLFTGDRFFGERARTVPRELGFRPRLDRPPHPYP